VKNYTKSIFCLLLTALFTTVAGCGYRFAEERNFPFQIRTLFVPVFENPTSETGIEAMITNDFIYEFVRSHNVRIAEKDMPDAFFHGVIRSFSTHTISRTDVRSPLERRITMILDLRLTDRHGQVLWALPGFSGSESFIVQPDKLITEGEKREALRTLSKRMAEIVYYQLMDIE